MWLMIPALSRDHGMPPDRVLIWGADWTFQGEREWLLSLLWPDRVLEVDWSDRIRPFALHRPTPVLLVESGRHRLMDDHTEVHQRAVMAARQNRLHSLQQAGSLQLIHLSDEEGLDADDWYSALPDSLTVWRNYDFGRWSSRAGVIVFPLGPTRAASANLLRMPVENRPLIWSFMGTAWSSGERKEAVRCFQQRIPERHCALLGEKFGSGLPREQYLQRLGESMFVLCPGGDRHFETFRFYEALESGAIPVVVNAHSNWQALFRQRQPPMSSHASWSQAAEEVATLVTQPDQLKELQRQVLHWWSAVRSDLADQLRKPPSSR